MGRWLAVHFWWKVVIACVMLPILATAMIILLSQHSYGPPRLDVETTEKLSVDELVGRFDPSGTRLVLPTWMPGRMKLQEIYLPSRMAVLVYGDEPIRHDILEGKAAVEVMRSNRSPTLEELKKEPSAEALKVGDFSVLLDEDPCPGPRWEERGIKPMLAYFYHDGFFYLITVRKGEFTRDDLIRILENMRPVGPETLRKP